jgi:hypothetical protein
MPQGGVIGAQQGFNVTVMPVRYSAAISVAQEIPIAGLLEAGVSVNVNLNYVVPQYVHKTKIPSISLATTFMVPVAWVTTPVVLGDLAHTVRHANAGMSDPHVDTQRGNPLQPEQQSGNQPHDLRAPLGDIVLHGFQGWACCRSPIVPLCGEARKTRSDDSVPSGSGIRGHESVEGRSAATAACSKTQSSI